MLLLRGRPHASSGGHFILWSPRTSYNLVVAHKCNMQKSDVLAGEDFVRAGRRTSDERLDLCGIASRVGLLADRPRRSVAEWCYSEAYRIGAGCGWVETGISG
jgi:hypothetical protein